MRRSATARVVFAALVMLIAVYLVVSYAYRGGTPTDEDLVQCAVCGDVLPREKMQVYPAESIGAAPDQLPVYVCTDACADEARANPEKYRRKALR